MHYSNLVLIPIVDDKSVEQLVEEAMGPHEEDGGFWDWYQIGGRWTGALDGYEPEKDPANQQSCHICGGTGFRADAPHIGPGTLPCNGCDATGTEISWPTGFKRHEGDIMPVGLVPKEAYKRFYRIVIHGGETFENETEKMPPLKWLQTEYPDYLCVVVDNHS